ncbi:MAG: hypothetical protein AB1304_06745 [Bacteroidota bacterium]
MDFLYQFSVIIVITVALILLASGHHTFYAKPDEFIEQVKSHKDTLVIKQYSDPAAFIRDIALVLLTKDNGNSGYTIYTYCNYKKYYIFRDIKNNIIDTIDNSPITNNLIKIRTKKGKWYYIKLMYLKIINDTLIEINKDKYGGVYINKKISIPVNDVDSVILKMPKSTYKGKAYKYKPTDKNCVSTRR